MERANFQWFFLQTKLKEEHYKGFKPELKKKLKRFLF
jgi:hypothetical protein